MGKSDHDIVHLIPSCRQRLKLAKPVVKTYGTWTDEAKEKTRAWLERAGCDEGYLGWAGAEAGNNFDTYTDTVNSFVSYCEAECVPTRTRVHYNNDKPWFTAQLRKLRLEKEAARQRGDKDGFREARYKFEAAAKREKQLYSQKLQKQFSDGNAASVWRGLKQITNYKPKPPQTTGNTHLVNELNEFYCRFENMSPPSATANFPFTP